MNPALHLEETGLVASTRDLRKTELKKTKGGSSWSQSFLICFFPCTPPVVSVATTCASLGRVFRALSESSVAMDGSSDEDFDVLSRLPAKTYDHQSDDSESSEETGSAEEYDLEEGEEEDEEA
eukprot:2420171-Rhodomonas_salina.4